MEKTIRIFPYSYSSLTAFETCPRKLYEERLAKTVERTTDAKTSEGTDIHKEIEDFIKDGTPMTNRYASKIIKVLQEIRGRGVVQAEVELCITRERKATTWWAGDCYSRDKVDILVIDGDQAWILDWKTGRPDEFSTQLKHNALLLMMLHPEINTVNTRYEWLKTGTNKPGKIYREFLEADWAKFEQRVAHYGRAKEQNVWASKPNFLCAKHCAVTSCEHHGKQYR